jgi:hypothetical protein
MKKIVVIAVFLSFFLSAIGCGGKKAVWSINVEGAKDKAVEFTSKDFEKLGTVDVDAVLKKSDGT